MQELLFLFKSTDKVSNDSFTAAIEFYMVIL